jgi:hypothetical protein
MFSEYWRAMGYATKGYDDSKEFYLKTGKRMKLHPMTRLWVEDALDVQESELSQYEAA